MNYLGKRQRRASTALLVTGYGTAAWAASQFVPMWRDRDVRRFVAFEAGTGMVVAGLALRGRPLEATANAVTATGLAGLWVARDRLRRR